MARISRVVLPGHPHHVVQRGVRSMDLFRNDSDQMKYLDLLKRNGARYGLQFIAYCLMSNHVHLIVIPDQETSLARGIGEAHRLYTRYINFNQGVRGYLFQGRFFSCPLDESHLYACARYVERNPVGVIAGIKIPWDYQWSSARYHMGQVNRDSLVSNYCWGIPTWEWGDLLLRSEDRDQFIKDQTRTGRPCGSKQFIQKAEQITGRNLEREKPGPRRS